MSKVAMEVAVAIAANATNDNTLTGQRFERSPADALLTLYTTGSAAGLTEELNVGGRSATPVMPSNVQNRSPIVPDDMRITEVEVFAGELIQLTIANTTGAALTHRARVELEEAEQF